jgi:hypothetical protein
MVKQNQNCYWTRNFFGEPELRCDNSMYAHDWYLYNDYPWWYRSDPYYYDNSGRCPQYYYYDASCGCCQYWGGGGFRDYNYSRGGSGGSGSGTTGNGKLRRTSSSSVISNPRAQSGLQGSAKTTTINTDVQNQKKLETMEQRRVQAKKAIEAAGSAAKEAAPENINQTPQPTRAEPVEVPRETSQPPAQSPSVQSAPNPPSGNSNPPPSNNGGSGNNDGNRRNPRSW